jgi:hypothetical protein
VLPDRTRRNRNLTIDAPLAEVAQRLGPAAHLAKFRGPGTAEKRPADLDDAAHVARTELAELTIDQALRYDPVPGQSTARRRRPRSADMLSLIAAPAG